MNHLLDIQGLSVQLPRKDGAITLVDDVSLHVDKGECFGVVGESGCGKSLTAFSTARLLSYPLQISRGSVLFESSIGEVDMLTLPARSLRSLRGKDISFIFQEPMNALDPVFTIEQQMSEAIRLHERNAAAADIRRRCLAMLDKVRIPRPEQTLKSYPHQLSGGQLQRIMIAIALLNTPKLLIADEPTTALDVTIQAQILELMNQLRHEFDMSVLIITHDLGVVAETCDRVAVLYAGQVIEEADVRTLFHHPAHPYTKGLLKAVVSLDEQSGHLYAIRGTVPPGGQWGKGCRFADRCDQCTERCAENMPPWTELGNQHRCRCIAGKEE